MGYFLLRHLELTGEVFHAVVLFLVLAAYLADELAVGTPEDYCRALVLVRKEFLIRQYLLASFIGVAAPELYLAEEVAGHAVDPVELALVAAVGAGVGVLHEPVGLAVAAEGLLAVLALDGVLENVVADSTDELGEEGLHVLGVENLVFFVDELLVLLRLVDY